MLTCPVCNRGGLKATCLTCPQCNADLESFQLLATLREGDPHATQRHDSSRNFMMLGLLVILVLTGWLWMDHRQLKSQFERSQQVIPTTSPVLTETLVKIDRFTDRLMGLEQQVNTLWMARPQIPPKQERPTSQSTAEEPFFLYAIRPNSRLWTIAQKFYGQGTHYALLLEHNPRLGILIGPQTGQIHILKEKAQGIALFNQFSFHDKGRTYYRYLVNTNDTWEQIAWKFYGDRNQTPQLRALNPGKELLPGERINVLLD